MKAIIMDRNLTEIQHKTKRIIFMIKLMDNNMQSKIYTLFKIFQCHNQMDFTHLINSILGKTPREPLRINLLLWFNIFSQI